MNQQHYQQGQQYPGYGQVPQQMQAPIQQQQPQEKHHHHFGQKAGGVGKALMNAAVWGFGATLGADAANGIFNGIKEEWHDH